MKTAKTRTRKPAEKKPAVVERVPAIELKTALDAAECEYIASLADVMKKRCVKNAMAKLDKANADADAARTAFAKTAIGTPARSAAAGKLTASLEKLRNAQENFRIIITRNAPAFVSAAEAYAVALTRFAWMRGESVTQNAIDQRRQEAPLADADAEAKAKAQKVSPQTLKFLFVLKALCAADARTTLLANYDNAALDAFVDYGYSDAFDVIECATLNVIETIAQRAANRVKFNATIPAKREALQAKLTKAKTAAKRKALEKELAALPATVFDYEYLADGDAKRQPACDVKRANRAAERCVNGARGINLENAWRTMYIEDFAPNGGDAENVLYKIASGLYVALASDGDFVKSANKKRIDFVINSLNLTATERRRLFAFVAGRTQAEIAKADGVKNSSVSETFSNIRIKAKRFMSDYADACEARGDTEKAKRARKTLETLETIRAVYDIPDSASAPVYTSAYKTPIFDKTISAAINSVRFAIANCDAAKMLAGTTISADALSYARLRYNRQAEKDAYREKVMRALHVYNVKKRRADAKAAMCEAGEVFADASKKLREAEKALANKKTPAKKRKQAEADAEACRKIMLAAELAYLAAERESFAVLTAYMEDKSVAGKAEKRPADILADVEKEAAAAKRKADVLKTERSRRLAKLAEARAKEFARIYKRAMRDAIRAVNNRQAAQEYVRIIETEAQGEALSELIASVVTQDFADARAETEAERTAKQADAKRREKAEKNARKQAEKNAAADKARADARREALAAELAEAEKELADALTELAKHTAKKERGALYQRAAEKLREAAGVYVDASADYAAAERKYMEARKTLASYEAERSAAHDFLEARKKAAEARERLAALEESAEAIINPAKLERARKRTQTAINKAAAAAIAAAQAYDTLEKDAAKLAEKRTLNAAAKKLASARNKRAQARAAVAKYDVCGADRRHVAEVWKRCEYLSECVENAKAFIA